MSSTLLFPDGDGNPTLELIALFNRPPTPHPLAAGTANVLSPCETPESVITDNSPPVCAVPSGSNCVPESID
ncbi:MAG: hypothetical protein ACREMU_09955, partial [Gemmatimonadaceae bacterium]